MTVHGVQPKVFGSLFENIFFLIREEIQSGKYTFQTQSTLGVKC